MEGYFKLRLQATVLLNVEKKAIWLIRNPYFQRLTVESNLPKIWTASINSAMLLRIKIKTLVPQANLKFVIKQMGTQVSFTSLSILCCGVCMSLCIK